MERISSEDMGETVLSFPSHKSCLPFRWSITNAMCDFWFVLLLKSPIQNWKFCSSLEGRTWPFIFIIINIAGTCVMWIILYSHVLYYNVKLFIAICGFCTFIVHGLMPFSSIIFIRKSHQYKREWKRKGGYSLVCIRMFSDNHNGNYSYEISTFNFML